ncbi:MAG: zinc ribbon domain-containing protein [Gammaproteobacteria bacterium]|jgi:putative FmdB family regulatory protein|nr:zinc ribbon domain-containing protein [Gammaproteobacteria bacterium]
MPIYEYRCDDCGHIFDALQKISDDPLKQCPACNEYALKKLLSAPKFRLKGSGWYETDFKTGDKRNIADSGSSASSSKSSETKKVAD